MLPPRGPWLLQQTLRILQATTFADLTGCRAQCTLQDTLYGTVGDFGTDTWTSPTRKVSRLSEQHCDVAQLQPASRYELTEPTIIEENDAFCENSTAKPYLHYLVSGPDGF